MFAGAAFGCEDCEDVLVMDDLKKTRNTKGKAKTKATKARAKLVPRLHAIVICGRHAHGRAFADIGGRFDTPASSTTDSASGQTALKTAYGHSCAGFGGALE